MKSLSEINATVSELSRLLGVSRYTVYRYLDDVDCERHFVVERHGQLQLFTLRGDL